MNYIELEKKLTAQIKKNRIIEIILSVLFLIILIVFWVLFEQSRVVEDIGWGPIKYQSVTYNHNFSWGILVGAVGFIPSIIVFIADLLFTKLVSFEISCDYITFYRGLIHTNLYINGELKDSIVYGYYMEATLSDRTNVNVALGKWSAHFTFSNGHQSIDI